MLDTALLKSLGNFWSEESNAVSFYFSEARPSNLAHSEGITATKEMARSIGRARPTAELRQIIERLEHRAAELVASSTRGIAIFAAPDRFWIELELAFAPKPRSYVGNSFLLNPLLPTLVDHPQYFVLLLDRSVTRLLLIQGEKGVERIRQVEEDRTAVRETGTSRKVSDERSKDDDTYHRFRQTGERLAGLLEQRVAEGIYVGCRNELWSEICNAMPDTVVRKVVDRFPCDPGLISTQEVLERMRPILRERRDQQLSETVEEIFQESARNGLGALGPNSVIRALEQGEIQTLVLAPNAPVAASMCTVCDHIDLGHRDVCTLCGNRVHRFEDLSEILIRRGTGGAFHIQQSPHSDNLHEAKGFLAKLRFRADHSSAQVA